MSSATKLAPMPPLVKPVFTGKCTSVDTPQARGAWNGKGAASSGTTKEDANNGIGWKYWSRKQTRRQVEILPAYPARRHCINRRPDAGACPVCDGTPLPSNIDLSNPEVQKGSYKAATVDSVRAKVVKVRGREVGADEKHYDVDGNLIRPFVSNSDDPNFWDVAWEKDPNNPELTKFLAKKKKSFFLPEPPKPVQQLKPSKDYKDYDKARKTLFHAFKYLEETSGDPWRDDDGRDLLWQARLKLLSDHLQEIGYKSTFDGRVIPINTSWVLPANDYTKYQLNHWYGRHGRKWPVGLKPEDMTLEVSVESVRSSNDAQGYSRALRNNNAIEGKGHKYAPNNQGPTKHDQRFESKIRSTPGYACAVLVNQIQDKKGEDQVVVRGEICGHDVTYESVPSTPRWQGSFAMKNMKWAPLHGRGSRDSGSRGRADKCESSDYVTNTTGHVSLSAFNPECQPRTYGSMDIGYDEDNPNAPIEDGESQESVAQMDIAHMNAAQVDSEPEPESVSVKGYTTDEQAQAEAILADKKYADLQLLKAIWEVESYMNDKQITDKFGISYDKLRWLRKKRTGAPVPKPRKPRKT